MKWDFITGSGSLIFIWSEVRVTILTLPHFFQPNSLKLQYNRRACTRSILSFIDTHWLLLSSPIDKIHYADFIIILHSNYMWYNFSGSTFPGHRPLFELVVVPKLAKHLIQWRNDFPYNFITRSKTLFWRFYSCDCIHRNILRVSSYVNLKIKMAS